MQILNGHGGTFYSPRIETNILLIAVSRGVKNCYLVTFRSLKIVAHWKTSAQGICLGFSRVLALYIRPNLS